MKYDAEGHPIYYRLVQSQVTRRDGVLNYSPENYYGADEPIENKMAIYIDMNGNYYASSFAAADQLFKVSPKTVNQVTNTIDDYTVTMTEDAYNPYVYHITATKEGHTFTGEWALSEKITFTEANAYTTAFLRAHITLKDSNNNSLNLTGNSHNTETTQPVTATDNGSMIPNVSFDKSYLVLDGTGLLDDGKTSLVNPDARIGQISFHNAEGGMDYYDIVAYQKNGKITLNYILVTDKYLTIEIGWPSSENSAWLMTKNGIDVMRGHAPIKVRLEEFDYDEGEYEAIESTNLKFQYEEYVKTQSGERIPLYYVKNKTTNDFVKDETGEKNKIVHGISDEYPATQYDYIQVTNIRLGTVDINVDLKWALGDYNPAPNSGIQKIKLKITGKAGDETNLSKVTYSQEVDVSKGIESVYLMNLPKYDQLGRLFTYTIAQEEITFKDSDGRDKTVLLNAATKKFILNEEEPNDDKRIMCEATRYPNRSTDTDSPSGSFNIYSYGNVLVNQASDAAVNPQNSQTDNILRCTILNKMSGTATFEVTKVWKDNNNVLDLRGDIFLNLFQSKVENGIVNSEVSRVNQEYNAVRQLVEYTLYDKSTEKTYHVSLTQDERDSLKYTVKLTDASATPAVVYNGEITIPPKTADMKVAFANELYLINLQSNNGTFFTVPAPSNLSIRDIHNYTFYYEPKGDILHLSFSKAERKTAQNPDANTTPVNYSVTLTERVSAEPNASKWYDVVMTHKETQISVGVSSVITTTYSGSMRMSETRDEDDYVGAFLDWFGNVYEEQDKGDGTKEIVIRDGTNNTENHLLLENGELGTKDQYGTYENAFGYELFTYTQNNNEMTSSRIAPVDYSRFSYEMELVTRETTVKTTAVFTQDNTDNNKYVAVVTIPNGDGSNDKATYSITLENVTGDLGQALVNAINGPGQLHHTTTGEAFPKNLYQAYRCITTENQTPGVSIYRFESLPRFDNDGYEIAYFANETYIKRGDYAAPYYELPDESDLRPKYFAYGDEPQKNKAKSDKYLANYAYNNSTIVNRLEDVITAKGSKRWKNIRVTLDKGYYPTAFFALYVKDPYKTYEDSAETHDGTATGFKITDAKLGELVYKTQTSTDEQGNTVETKIYNVQRVDPGNLTYNIKEQHIEAYTNNIQQDKSLPSLIVNTYNSTETMDFEIKKDWKNIDLDLYYPTVVIYLSQKIKISKGETIFKNGRQQAADKDIYETYYNYPAVILRKGYDSAEFKNLPKTDPRGNDFIYTVKEVMRLYNGEEIENELMDEDGHPRPSSSQDEEIPEANGYRMKIDVEDLPSVQEYVLTGKDGNNNTVKYYATFNLTDGSGYHYQVVFKDNNGNIVTLPDNIEAPDAFADLGSLLQGKTISVGGRNITINNTFTSQKLNSAVKRYVLTNHQEARQADGTIVDEGKKYVVTFKGVPETQGMYDIDLTDGTTHYTYMEQTEGSSTYVRKAYLFEDDPSDLGDALIRDHLTLRVVTAVTEPTPETNNGCLVGFTSAEAEVLEYELTDNKSTPDDPTDDKVYHALFVQDPNELNVYYAEITDGNGISYTGTITTEKGLEDLDLGEWCVLNNANIGGLSINRDTFTSKLLTDSHITRTPRITNTYSPDVNNFQTEINVDKEWTTNDGVTLGAEYGSLYNRKLQYVLQRRTARLETKNLFSLLVGGQTIQFYEDEAKRIPAENTTDYYDIVYDEPQIVVSDYFPEGADTTLEENKVIPVDQNFGIYVKKTKTNENDPDEYLDLRSSSTDESYYKFTKRQSGKDLRGNSITAASSVYRKVIYFQDVHYDELTETTSENLIPVIITIDLTEPGNYLTRIQHLAAYGQDGSLYTYKVVEDPSDLFEQYDKKEADEEETIDKSEEEIHTPNTQECSADWQANLYLFNKLITAKIGIVKTFGAELPDGTVAKLPKEDYEQFFDDARPMKSARSRERSAQGMILRMTKPPSPTIWFPVRRSSTLS